MRESMGGEHSGERTVVRGRVWTKIICMEVDICEKSHLCEEMWLFLY